MSHDKKKKSKKSIEDARVPVEAVSDTAKGSSGIVEKGSGDVKTRVKSTVPGTKISSKKHHT